MTELEDTPPPRPKPKRTAWMRVRRVLKGIAVTIGLLFAIALAFLYWASREGHLAAWAREEVVRELSTICKIDATFETFRFDPFPPQITMSGLKMNHQDGSHLISVDEAIVNLQILPLFASRIQLDRVALLEPRATIQLQDGQIARLPPCVAPSSEKQKTPIVLGVRELTIEKGSFDLIVDDKLEARLNAIGVSLSPRQRSAGSNIAIGVDNSTVTYAGRKLDLKKFRVEGQLEGLLTAPRAIVIDVLDVELERVVAKGSASIDLLGPVYEAKLAINAPLETIADFTDEVPPATGDLRVEVSLSGSADNPSGVGKLILSGGKVGPYEAAERVELHFAADTKGLDVRGFDVTIGDGTVKGTAHIDFDEHFTVRAEADVDGFPLGRFLECINVPNAWVDWRAYGKTTMTGTLHPFQIDGPFGWDIRDFYVFDRAYHKPEVRDKSTVDPELVLLHPANITVAGRWRFDTKGLHIFEADLASGASSHGFARAFIGFRTQDGIHIEASLSRLDFNDVGRIANIAFGGRGTVSGIISGTHDLVGATGKVELEDTTVTGIPFGHTKASLVWHDDTMLDFHEITAKLGKTSYGGELSVDIRKEVPFKIRGKIVEGRVEDVLVPFGVDGAEWGDPTGAVHGTFALDGPITKLSGPIDLTLKNAAIVGETFDSGRIVGRMEKGNVVVEDFELDKHGAQISGRGRIDPLTTVTRAHVRARGMTLQKIDLMKASQPALDAKMTLSMSLSGALKTITGTVTSKLTEVTAGPQSLPDGEFIGHFDGPMLAVKGRLLGGALEADGEIDLVRKLPYRATLELSELDIPRLLGALKGHLRWSGIVAGRARLSGSLIDWHLSSGELQLARAQLDTGSFQLETAAPASFVMREGVLDTKHISLIGPRTRLTAEGRLGAHVLDLKVLGRVDLGIAELLSPSVERVGGVLSLDSAVQGAPGNMNLVGTGKIEGGILQWRGFDERLSAFNADLIFSQSTVLIDRGEGRFAGGRLGITGNLLLSDYNVKNVALSLVLDDIRPRLTYPLVELSGVLNGTMSVEGTLQRLSVRGDLDVRRGRAKPELDIVNLNNRTRLQVNVYDPSAEVLDFDINFHALDHLLVKNDTIDVEMTGDLRLTGTNQRFGILGTTNLVRGGRMVVLDREYEVASGVIEFQDRYRFSPRYDVTLLTDACAARITVNVVGTLQQKPQTNYSSNPEMDETNILSCLIRGVKVQDKYDDLAEFASRTLWKYSGLDREVKKVLPIDDIDVTSEYSSLTKTYEPRVLIAKELTILGGPARLEYTSSLGKKEDQELRLRYRITPGLTLQGGWSSSKQVQPVVGDLHLDLKYRWEW